MEKQVINPWTWQDRFGLVQAIKVTGAEQVLDCSGQTSVDEDGNPLNACEMQEQALQAIDNLETVLREAGFELADIVQVTTYVTDVDAYLQAAPAVGARLGQAGVKRAASLIGVARLALPRAARRDRRDSSEVTHGRSSIIPALSPGAKAGHHQVKRSRPPVRTSSGACLDRHRRLRRGSDQGATGHARRSWQKPRRRRNPHRGTRRRPAAKQALSRALPGRPRTGRRAEKRHHRSRPAGI